MQLLEEIKVMTESKAKAEAQLAEAQARASELQDKMQGASEAHCAALLVSPTLSLCCNMLRF
jgi:hypothetical protein